MVTSTVSQFSSKNKGGITQMVKATRQQIDAILVAGFIGVPIDDIAAKFDKSIHWVNRVRVLPAYKERKKVVGKFLARALPMVEEGEAIVYSHNEIEDWLKKD